MYSVTSEQESIIEMAEALNDAGELTAAREVSFPGRGLPVRLEL